MQNFTPPRGTMPFRPLPGSVIALAGSLQPKVRIMEQVSENGFWVLPCR